MGRILVLALTLSLALSACGRKFDPPPPVPDVVTLTSLSSEAAFAGARITLNGTHFEQQPEANLVFFGSTSAEIDTLASKVADGRLVVEVPVLVDINQLYSVTVSTTNGQAVLADVFFYLGPGHPSNEQVHHLLPIEASPHTVAVVLPDEDLPFFNPALVTNTSSQTISLMDLETGWHMDLGFPGQPMSAVLLPWDDEPAQDGEDADPSLVEWRAQVDEGCYEILQYAIYVTVMEVGTSGVNGGTSLRTELRSKKLTFVLPAPNANADTCSSTWTQHRVDQGWFQPVLSDLPPGASLALPEPMPGTDPWMPNLLQLTCVELDPNAIDDTVDCRRRALAVTDYYRPDLVIYPVETFPYSRRFRLGGPTPVSLDTTGSGCANAVQTRVGPVLDMAYRPGWPAMLVVAEGRPELWRIDIQGGADNFTLDSRPIWPRSELLNLPDEVYNQIGWDRSVVSPEQVCHLRFTALAAGSEDNSDEVYLADSTTGSIIEALYADDFIVMPGVEAVVPKRAVVLGTPVFALQTALSQAGGVARELLYAATEEGLSVIEAGDIAPESFEEIGFLELPTSRGGSGSLTRYGHATTGWNDRVALADAARNQLFIIEAGDLDDRLQPFPAGMVRPQVAASQWADQLYVADPLSNTIRLLDQNTGLQVGKFPIQGDQDLGATGLRCLHRYGPDLLLVPMANEILDPTAEFKTFDKVVVRRTENLKALDDLIGIGWDRMLDEAPIQTDYPAHHFHEALVAEDDELIYLVQYQDPAVDGSGVVWPAGIDPLGAIEGVLKDGEDFSQFKEDQGRDDLDRLAATGRALPSWVRLVRLTADGRKLVFFGIQGQGGSLVGRVEVYETATLSGDQGPSQALELPAMVSLLVEDLAVWSEGERTVLFFSLPEAGKVVALLLGEDGGYTEKYLETTGAPRWLAFSPDRHRLYATHRAEGKLSIINTDCQPLDTCSGTEDCLLEGCCPPGWTCRNGTCQAPGGCFDFYPCAGPQDCPPGSTCIDEPDMGMPAHCEPDGYTETGPCESGFACSVPFGDCLPMACASLLVTLPVELYPDKVVFHPSGKNAYLTHEGSNVITVIE